MKYNYNYNKTKKNVTKIVILFFIIFTILVTNFFINLYNEKTSINVKTEDINNIYIKYDTAINNTYNTLDQICIKKDNIYILKDEYKNNELYTEYNNILLKLSNILNSSDSVLLIENKYESIDYKTIKFDYRMSSYKQVLYNMTNSDEHIINSYINTTINLLTINSDDSYYYSKKNLFNISGKKYIYNDYKKILENELELINIVYNIIQHINNEI